MKTVVCTRYGPPEVLQLKEVEKPTPKDNEVLVKVHATTVTAGDAEIRRGEAPFLFWLGIRLMIGIRRPRKALGMELAGEIEAVGKDVTRFKVGDQVFGPTGMGLGGYAEYKCLPEDGMVAIKPSNMTYEEAAAISIGGLEAYHLLRRSNIHKGQKVLIYGASGSIGTFAVQLARYYGADITAVGGPMSLELLESLGADKVFDYTKGDFANNDETYDVILDAVGKSSFSEMVSLLTKRGIFLMASPRLSHMVRKPLVSMSSSKRIIYGAVNWKTEDLDFLRGLIEARKLKTVVDRNYPLAEITEAHRYVDKGQKIGNVVIAVPGETETSDKKN